MTTLRGSKWQTNVTFVQSRLREKKHFGNKHSSATSATGRLADLVLVLFMMSNTENKIIHKQKKLIISCISALITEIERKYSILTSRDRKR